MHTLFYERLPFDSGVQTLSTPLPYTEPATPTVTIADNQPCVAYKHSPGFTGPAITDGVAFDPMLGTAPIWCTGFAARLLVKLKNNTADGRYGGIKARLKIISPARDSGVLDYPAEIIASGGGTQDCLLGWRYVPSSMTPTYEVYIWETYHQPDNVQLTIESVRLWSAPGHIVGGMGSRTPMLTFTDKGWHQVAFHSGRIGTGTPTVQLMARADFNGVLATSSETDYMGTGASPSPLFLAPGIELQINESKTPEFFAQSTVPTDLVVVSAIQAIVHPV